MPAYQGPIHCHLCWCPSRVVHCTLGSTGTQTPVCIHRSRPRATRVRMRIGECVLHVVCVRVVLRRRHIHSLRMFVLAVSECDRHQAYLPCLRIAFCERFCPIESCVSNESMWCAAK